MKTDAFVQAAAWHRRQGVPCQDSVLTRASDAGVSLVVADGCSSGAHSEYGSLAMARAASLLDVSTPLPEVTVTLKQWQVLGAWDDEAMLATALRLSYRNMDNPLVFEALGDGVGGALLDNGETWCWAVDWDNLPPYPWYRVNGMHTQWAASAQPGKLSVWRNGVLIDTQAISQEEPYVRLVAPENWTAAWLGSDGWLTLGLTLPELAGEVTAYKSTEGTFLKRRLSRLLAGLSKNGVEAGDDLGMVALLKGT